MAAGVFDWGVGEVDWLHTGRHTDSGLLTKPRSQGRIELLENYR